MIFNPRRADLKLRHPAYRVQRRVRQPVDRLHPAPVERHKHRILPYAARYPGRELRLPPPRRQPDGLPVPNPVALRRNRMQLRQRNRRNVPQLPDAPRLRPRLILRQVAPRGQMQRIFPVRRLRRLLMPHRMKPRPSVRSGKPVPKHPRRPRMPGVRARPEHPVLRVNPRVADARIIGRPARRRPAQFRKNLGLILIPEIRPSPQPFRQLANHGYVVPHPLRHLKNPPPPDDPPLQVRHRPRLLRPLRRRQYHIRVSRRLRAEKIRHRQKIQRPQPFPNVNRIGRRYRHIGTHHQQRPHAPLLPQAV